MPSKFRSVIKRLIEQNNLKPAALDDEQAEIHIDLEDGGGSFTVFLTLDEDNLVEFAVPSEAIFDNEDELPHTTSTTLLKRNTQLAIGYWTLVEDDGVAFTLMDLEDLDVLDEEGGEYFSGIISDMIGEVAEFNELWRQEGN